jgi:hypothetical protein
MTLTRKHFEVIAEELRTNRPALLEDNAGYDRAVVAISRALRKINPRFDSDRFYLATCRDDNDLLGIYGDTRCSPN